MFVRVLVAALAALAMVSGASAQCTAPLVLESCTSTEMTATNAAGSTATLNIFFSYCAPAIGYGTGQIIAGSVGGALTLQPGNTGYIVSALTGSITTGPSSTVSTPSLPAGQFPILTFSTNSVPTTPVGGVTPAGAGTPASITIHGETVSILSNSPTVISSGVTLPLSTNTLPSNLQNLVSVSQDSCTAVRGDPLFRGFKGQQFYVGGEDGQVMNMISTFNMQLNGRFITLNEGAAITPVEQEKLRLLSMVRNAEQPEVAPFPLTTAWSHPGNYFGEAGVAMLEDNRLYAKAGPFATGFSKVALNGRPLAVSNDFVVLGSGANTTYIQRVSAHEVMVRTVNVEFTLTNSDNFLNVEQVHLERGFRQHNQFSGILGKTVDAKWSWNAEDEKAAVVQSNDLFAKEQ